MNDIPTGVRPMMSVKQVLELVPVSKTSLRRWMRQGAFPKPRKLGENRIMWYRDEIEGWQKALSDDPIEQARWSK